jgi:hypothetical protein
MTFDLQAAYDASRIGSSLKSSTQQFGWLQATATISKAWCQDRLTRRVTGELGPPVCSPIRPTQIPNQRFRTIRDVDLPLDYVLRSDGHYWTTIEPGCVPKDELCTSI